MSVTVETITEHVYRLVCDRCGDLMPTPVRPHTEDELRAMRENEGWHTIESWNGLEYIRDDFCPDCIEEVGR